MRAELFLPVVPAFFQGLGRAAMPTDQPLRGTAGGVPFDSVSPLFRAQEQRPAGLAPVDPAELSALQRGLLAIDGTVTTFLSAWALEPIVIMPVAQRTTTAPASPWLELPAATPVIERAVLLLGGRSDRLYAYAESVICIGRLPEAHRAGLMTGGLSIGQLLLMPGFDSRREGLWYGREFLAAPPPAVAERSGPEFLSRTYRVSSDSRPLMLITERFPWTLRD